MKILVLGGTGFLGPHEIDQFEDRDWEITIFNRGQSKTNLFESDFAQVAPPETSNSSPPGGQGRRRMPISRSGSLTISPVCTRQSCA